MEPTNEWSRRALLRASIAVVPLAAAPRWILGANCAPTPEQTEGPFYMGGLRGIPKPAVWNDLTRVLGARIAADGEAIEVTGIVTDRECRPLAGAQVEIWQACATGRYAHPRDGNPAALDPNFGYFGIAETDASGRYRFKTIKPGAYPVGGSWVRPSHIHFRVEAPGMRRLTTQMYFAGDPHQDRDGVLMALSSAERRRVIVEPDRPAAPDDAAGAEYRFDLTLLSVST